MAIMGTEGFSSLPKHCTALMAGFFAMGILICIIRDILPKRFARFVPS